MWTAYPSAFASIASTLELPLFATAVGIILRGAAYALRAGTRTAREARVLGTGFALSSLIMPFVLGTIVGAIASPRVPLGNAADGLVFSWTSTLSVLTGVMAVCFGAYLAAVFLCADAVRHGERELERRFRLRALAAGSAAGLVAAPASPCFTSAPLSPSPVGAGPARPDRLRAPAACARWRSSSHAATSPRATPAR